jgi:NAD(P)-dependent dehydrogenase (short-subunit alcohol dehydrogenase family)
MTATAPRTVLLTGGTRGIGFETARRFAGLGYRVILTGRSQGACDAAAQAVTSAVPNSVVVGRAVDMSSLASIRAFVKSLLESEDQVHVLVNNAGLVGLPPTRQVTAEGMEVTLATNVFGPFLLTNLLLDRLRASAPARVVNVGSRMHLPKSGMGAEVHWDWDDVMCERAYDPVVVYKNSKLALMWLGFGLAERLAGSGVSVNTVHPGFVPTTIAEHRKGISRFFFKHVMPLFPGTQTVEQGAANTVFAATSPAYAEKSGSFIAEEKEEACSEQAREPREITRFWALASKLTGIEARETGAQASA